MIVDLRDDVIMGEVWYIGHRKSYMPSKINNHVIY